jgi:hypothetical protein
LLTPPSLRLWLFQMRVPDSVNMFSDLGHYPRDTVQVRRDDPVPAGVPRDFNTRMADTQRRTTTDYARADPTGSDRYAALSPNPSSPSPNPLHASVSRGSQVCGHGHICTRVGVHVTTRVCRWMNLLTFLFGGQTQSRHSPDTSSPPTRPSFIVTNRYRYSEQPRQPGLPSDMPNLVLAEHSMPRLSAVTANRLAAEEAGVGSTRTVGTQSDYRESETQTDPWTAPHTVRPGSAPEVLTLQSLSYGQ